MRGGIFGDFGQLRHWGNLLRAGELLMGQVTRKQAERTLELVGEGFDQQHDPYGLPWKPKRRPDGRKILHGPTGRLRNFKALYEGRRRFMVVPGADYGAAHQQPRGGKRPQRMMVPSSERGIPPRWSRQLSRAAVQAMREHFRK